MNTEEKLTIAVKLLECGISMGKIRFSSPHELSQLAERNHLDPNDLAVFAEEVANRSTYLAARKDEERVRWAGTTVLLTDDELITTQAMQLDTDMPEHLSGRKALLESGVEVVFRVRNKDLAQRCSETLGQQIETTNDPLPKLRQNDIVMLLSNRQQSNRPVKVIVQPYSP